MNKKIIYTIAIILNVSLLAGCAQSQNTYANNSKGSSSMVESLSIPDWAQKILQIDENHSMDREAKISALLKTLEKSKSSIKITTTLQTLAKYNPAEGINQILPYLSSSHEEIQSAALAALNNSMIPTEKEDGGRKINPEFAKARLSIAPAVNQLYYNPKTSDNLKLVIISGYPATNGNPIDTQKMFNVVISEQNINPSKSAFLATTLSNKQDNIVELLEAVETLPSSDKEKVIYRVGLNITSSIMSVSIYDKKQRDSLINLFRNNPPQSTGTESIGSKDLWNRAIKKLSK